MKRQVKCQNLCPRPVDPCYAHLILSSPSEPMFFRFPCFCLPVLILALGWLGGGVRVEGAVTILAGWDMNGLTAYGVSPFAPNTAAANINVGGLTRGSGVTTSGTAAGNAWGGNGFDAISAAAAITANDFITFSITAAAGHTVSIDSIDPYNIRRSSSGPTTGLWQYQIGSGAFVDIGSAITWGSSTAAAGNSQSAIDLSGISALQNVGSGTTVTFRVVNFGASANTGTWYLNNFQTGNDFVINGEIKPVSASADLYWLGADTNRGGPGIWSGSATSWSTTDADGGPGVTWDSAKKAIFGGTGDTVTVSGTVAAAAGIDFQSTGYTVSGGDAISLTGTSAAANSIATATDVTATIATNLTGSAGMTKAGPGTLVLTGDKGYTGGTVISGGSLQLGDGATNGSVAGDVTNNANLTFNNGSTQTFGGEISGTGSLTKIGAGALTLSGTNNYSGGTTVSAGSLIGTTSSLKGAITNDAAVTFDQSGDGTYVGIMSGSGSLTKLGTGAVTLSGTNSYSGGTTVTAGRLIGTTDSLQGAITNDAAVTFDQSGDGTYVGIMSGSGSLTKLGTGAVTLSGTNSYSGGTTVTAGRLIGTTDSLQGAITNNAAVTFDQTTDGTYAGSMSGSGSLTKSGAGAVTLSGDNSYSGGTSINAGTLIAASDTSLGTAAVTLSNATLLATSDVTVANNLVVNPGVGASAVIAYWNFNTYDGSATSIAATSGSGTIDLTGWGGTLSNFGGTTLNALNSDAAGASLSLIGTGGNNTFVQISGLDLTGYTNVAVTYATQRTSNGFNQGQWSYSVDGSSFTNFGTVVAPPTSYAVATPGTTSGLENINSGFLRYTLSGASVTSQNNRIDNLQIVASQELPSVIGSSVAGNSTFSGQITLNGGTQLSAGSASSVVFTGQIANGSNGARGIEKVGAGLVELTGANTYSGATTISAGTLAVNNSTGSGTGTGNVVVKSNGVLAGSGTLSPADGGSIEFESGSTVAVGNVGDVAGQQLSFIPDSGTITTTFRSGSKLEFDLFSNAGDNSSISAAADRLFLNGSAVFQTNVTLRVNTALDSLLFAEGDAWKLLDWSSLSITGNTADLTLELPTLSGTLYWNTSQLFTTGNVTIVPEPSRALLAGLGLVSLGLRRRRLRPLIFG
jgi:autotransporter-associated beta strand protein